jgi:NADH-quinone oxidoreductase subunit M
MGAWQKADTMYRIATMLACASIVVTAVYILRAMGKVIMGPLQVEGDGNTIMLTDAGWNEKVAAALLIIGIVAIGMAPFWLTALIKS